MTELHHFALPKRNDNMTTVTTTHDDDGSEKFNMFDFEQSLLDCWNVTSDLRDVLKAKDIISHDKLVRVIDGIQELYEIKFDALFRQFEQAVKEKRLGNT